MRTSVITLLVAAVILASPKAPATLYVSSPPGNIVQNGTFAGYNFDYWSGLIAIGGSPYSPNGIAAFGSDIYQDLLTTPGQQYLLDFYAAADLYFGPTLTLNVALNSQTTLSFTTPPYTYNNQVNRQDQMRWQEYSTPFTAASGSTRLEFIDLNTYDFGLSAVSAVPIPEPATAALALVAGILMVCFLHWRRQTHPNTTRDCVKRLAT
jgi:hypothetical protein